MPKGVNGTVAIVDSYARDLSLHQKVQSYRSTTCVWFDIVTRNPIVFADLADKFRKFAFSTWITQRGVEFHGLFFFFGGFVEKSFHSTSKNSCRLSHL